MTLAFFLRSNGLHLEAPKTSGWGSEHSVLGFLSRSGFSDFAGSSLRKSYGWIDGEHGKLMRWLALSTICLEIGGQGVSGGSGGGAKRG